MALKHPARSRRWNTEVVWKTVEVSEPFKVPLYFLPPAKWVRAEMSGERALPRITCTMLWWKASNSFRGKVSHIIFSITVLWIETLQRRLLRFYCVFAPLSFSVKYVLVHIKSLETPLSHWKTAPEVSETSQSPFNLVTLWHHICIIYAYILSGSETEWKLKTGQRRSETGFSGAGSGVCELTNVRQVFRRAGLKETGAKTGRLEQR